MLQTQHMGQARLNQLSAETTYVYLRTMSQKQNMGSAKLAQLSGEGAYVLRANYAPKTEHGSSKTCSIVRRNNLWFAYETKN